MEHFSAALVALMGSAVLVGAVTQRLTGIGFALVAAPLLVLAAGPHVGVLLANALAFCTNILLLAQVWRNVELKRVALLAVPALLAFPLGLWTAALVPAPALMVGIGAISVAALLAVRYARKLGIFHGWGGAVTAGALSGFMTVTAGIGGPAVTIYALGSGWGHRSFVASIQLYFAIVNGSAVLAKGLPPVGPLEGGTLLAALAAGLLIGQRLAPHVPMERGRQAALALAIAGSLATMVKGFMGG
ncbi:TSUP family transporter [Roseomonas sp. 18066]|uniref:TSUP family transporter n=1 Tax=Roseomonas sp. 18066 TaxID=2681412 RepID=UPI001359843E|nr:TSUP family transporter [Roseomonas sp. 18066]